MDSMTSVFKRMGLKVPDKPMSQEDFRKFTVDCYNESEGDLHKEDGIHCIICKNKGWIQVLEDNYEPHRHCKCWARREAYKKAKQSGLGKYLKKTLDDYETLDADWRGKCKRVVEGYIERHSHDDVWFIACGQNGSGKTLLGSIIANTLLTKKEKAVMYVVWTDFIGEVKRDMMGEKTNEVSVRMKEIKNAEVLFLDEVFKEYNATDRRYLAEIINYRYTNDLKTIITSEKLLNELLDIDEATFGRAVEKCEGFMINIPRDRKKDWRIRNLRL
jgi:DNA replication protein DnaC